MTSKAALAQRLGEQVTSKAALAQRLVLFALALGATCLFAGAANAGTVKDERPLIGACDASDTTAGPFTQPDSIAIDEETGGVYVINLAGSEKGPGPFDGKRVVNKFNAKCEAQNFAATGKSSLDGSATPSKAFGVEGFFSLGAPSVDIAVDNSGGAGGPGKGEQGRIYVSETGAGTVHAFDPDGTYLWSLPSAEISECGVAVDGDGHLWIIDAVQREALEFANSGSPPPAQVGSFPLPSPPGIFPCTPAVDQGGNTLYIAQGSQVAGTKDGSVPPEKWVGGVFDSLLSATDTREVAVDQSSLTGHVFTAQERTATGASIEEVASFAEFDAAGAELGRWGGQVLGGSAAGIAYNPSLDRVYVADGASGEVKVFGLAATGTVPDVAMEQSSGITKTEATAHGTVNPQGVPNEYRFQWAIGGEEVQHLRVNASSGTFTIDTGSCCPELSEPTPGCCPQFTDPLPFDVSPAALQAALEGLSLIGAGNVSVTGTPSDGAENPTNYVPGEYDIVFTGGLAGVNVQQLRARNIDLSGVNGPGAQTSTLASGPNWGIAQSSAPQSLAEDSADHEVFLPLSGLKQNTTYSVRLVGINAESGSKKGLSSYSPPDIFTTLKPDPPEIEDCEVSEITTESAHVACTINPQGDETVWRVLTRAQPGASEAECASLGEAGFSKAKEGTISSEEPGTVDIEADLALLPAQTYCLRVAATNNGGSDKSDSVLITLAIPPSEASAAFAVPRTDTSARINARVNPEGEADFKYRFELSEDGGETWALLPERESSIDAREQIVIAEELDDLEPDTSYRFRLGLLKNSGVEGSGGPAGALGEEREFVTRMTAEVTLPPSAYPGEPNKRGIELVSNPDKGNQNVLAEGPRSRGGAPAPAMTEDGERVLWFVTAGAPGAPNGTQVNFLAERGEEGWVSESVNPPAEEQVGKGDFFYRMMNATPDFESFILSAQLSTGFAEPPPPLDVVRVRRDGQQDILKVSEESRVDVQELLDMSDNGDHVVLVNRETGKLEDVSTPGKPELISVMPDGLPAACDLAIIGSTFGQHALWHHGYHWVAASDGSRVYFPVGPNKPGSKSDECNTEASSGGLYVRDREAGKTTLIDPVGVDFIRATHDGHAAYFLTTSSCREFRYPQLTCKTPESADLNKSVDIYRWDEEAGKSSCLTCVVEDAQVSREGVMISEDFSHIYFLSIEQFVPGQGNAGTLNLYVLSGGEIRFVALADSETLEWQSHPGLSTNGNVLLFRALARPSLTADPMAAQCIRPEGGGEETLAQCRQIYRYDDRDGSIECISCRHDAPTAHSVGSPGLDQNSYRLSGDGSTVGFVSRAPLVPLDVNDDSDVYEWRNGVHRLISDGVSDFPTDYAGPQVMGVDGDGTDLLFGLVPSGGSLTGFELDGLLNLYDARIGGGFEPPPPDEHCVEDSCQGPLRAAPRLEQPASATFEGRGNLKTPPKKRHCAGKHGKAKRRCVAKQRRRAARAKQRRDR